MNNKLFARIAAAAVGVSMLATVAFAADPAPSVTEEGSLSFATETADKFTSDADQITLMAYVVDDETPVGPEAVPAYDEETMTIVALDQVAGKDGFSVIPLDATLLGDAKKVAIKVGGTGIDTPFATVLAIGEAEAPAVLLGDVTGDEFIDFEDAYVIYLYEAFEFERITDEGYRQFWDDADENVALAVGDVTGDGFVDFEDAYVIYLYEAFEYDRIIDEGYTKFWKD